MKPQEVFVWSLTFWSYFKSIRAKKSSSAKYSDKAKRRILLGFSLIDQLEFFVRKVLFQISYVTTFWITYSLFLFKWKPWPRLTQTQQYQYTDLELSISPISQHTQWRLMKTFQCVSISDTHHSTRLYTLFYIIRTLPSIIPEEIIICFVNRTTLVLLFEKTNIFTYVKNIRFLFINERL
jgi:hypothetical protein